MKTKTMTDIKDTLADLLDYVQAVRKYTNALSCSIEVKTDNFHRPLAHFRIHLKSETYLRLLKTGIHIDDNSVLPSGTYSIGPNTIKESFGVLHADGSLFFTNADLDFAECITDIELTACATRARDQGKEESPSYQEFLRMYADAEQARLEKMLQ